MSDQTNEQPPALSVVQGGAPAAQSPPDVPATPSAQAPSVCRNVLYVDHDKNVSAAIITGVNDDGTVAVEVFYRDGVPGFPRHGSVPFDAEGGGHTWHWPPRV